VSAGGSESTAEALERRVTADRVLTFSVPQRFAVTANLRTNVRVSRAPKTSSGVTGYHSQRLAFER
jgi:hypothetical protein